MHKVYRYEEQFNSEGPYTCEWNRIRGNDVCIGINNKHSVTRPSIRNDGLEFAGDSGDEYKVACDSLKNLKAWFKGFNSRLLNSGFVIAEYTVSKKIDGYSKKQCVFHKTDVIKKEIIAQKYKCEYGQWKKI
jgi:hypothetical protein